MAACLTLFDKVTVISRKIVTKPNLPVIGTSDIESRLTITVPVMCTGMHAQNCYHDCKAKAAHTNAIIILYSQRDSFKFEYHIK